MPTAHRVGMCCDWGSAGSTEFTDRFTVRPSAETRRGPSSFARDVPPNGVHGPQEPEGSCKPPCTLARVDRFQSAPIRSRLQFFPTTIASASRAIRRDSADPDAMLKQTPFHARTAPLILGQAWRRWAGHAVASAYDWTHDR